MQIFNGILNDNGIERKIKLFLDDELFLPCTGDFYIEDIQTDANIDMNIITVQNIKYEYHIKKCDDEILIIGKEISSFLHKILYCLYKQKFFVLTNKDEV